MNLMILVGTALCVLTALLVFLCAGIYSRMAKLDSKSQAGHQTWSQLEVKMHDLLQVQESIHSRIDQLSMDVLHREIYQGPEDRHQLAIKAAKEGEGASEIMEKHGLSADEASLVVSLHGDASQTHSQPQHVLGSAA